MRWLIPLATAGWAVWTWAADRERQRREERARISALYVNPFLSACEDLQSRIYSILELGGLRSLRERYPDGSYADETLYLIVRYFGWAVALERHGEYTQDPVVMRLGSAVRFKVIQVRQIDGQVLFRYRSLHSGRIAVCVKLMEDRKRFSPKPLSAEEPIAKLVVDRCLSQSAVRQPFDNVLFGQMAAAQGTRDALYLAHGNLLGMNGNYSAGVLEGCVHYMPEILAWIDEESLYDV